jgi:hypothetical protein
MELDLEKEFADRAYPNAGQPGHAAPDCARHHHQPDGKVNAAPFSFFNLLGATRPSAPSRPATATTARPRTPRSTSAPRMNSS